MSFQQSGAKNGLTVFLQHAFPPFQQGTPPAQQGIALAAAPARSHDHRSAVARPCKRGRTATEARACDRPCAADKRKAWRGGRVALCDGDALSRVKKMLAFFVWEKSWP